MNKWKIFVTLLWYLKRSALLEAKIYQQFIFAIISTFCFLYIEAKFIHTGMTTILIEA